MALDAVMLKVTADELRQSLLGARVDKIFMPSRDTVIMNVRNEKGSRRLLLSARSGMARVHFTDEEFDNPSTPPAFCMLLRKYLQSGRILNVRSVDGERILFFDFETINEMGDRTPIVVSMELMGRYSNFVLVNAENKVIDALKHIDADQSDKRQLFPGILFTMPPVQNKPPFLSTPTAELIALIKAQSKPLSSAILGSTVGIGPVVCREIAYFVTKEDKDADLLTDTEQQLLVQAIDNVKASAEGENRHLSIVYDDETPIEFSFIPLNQYEGLKTVPFETVSSLLDCYYSARDRAELMKARSSDLKRQVHTILERTLRRQHSREEELNSTEKADRSKLYGELLTAYLGQLTKGMKSASVLNYYTNEMIDIPLDPQKNPIQNAQKYYRDYRKLTTARKILGELLEEGKNEIAYLQSVGYEVEVAETEEEFLNIRRELKDAGYLKSYRMPKGKQKKTKEFFSYRSGDGFLILAGRNNAANDKLTLRTAAKKDLWFHVKDGAGSHTVLVLDGKSPSNQSMTEAAMIAAFHSSQLLGEHIAVDYTEIRNVKKAPGQKTGMVIYSDYQTAFVTPSAEQVKKLEIDYK